MHIVFFSRRAWPSIGGVEKHLYHVCEALKELDSSLKISVITEQSEQNLSLEEQHKGVNYYRFTLARNPDNPEHILTKKSVAAGMKELIPIIREADVLHVHDVFFWLLPIYPFIFSKKIFVTFHGYEIPGPPNWKQQFWHRLAAFLSRGNICIGGFHPKWYGVKPTITSFGAVSLSGKISDKNIKKLFSKKKIVYVGRLDSDNAVWEYLKSLAVLHQQKKLQFTLDVIGDGAEKKELEAFVQKNNLPIRFLGQQQVSPETYAEYDLSLGTGYLSVLESLSAGVPVVATYITELKKDYFEQTPFAQWIKIVSPENLQHSIELAMKPLPLEAQEWAQQQTWQKLARQYVELWQR